MNPKPPRKADLVNRLLALMTPDMWDLIAQLRGRLPSDTDRGRADLLRKLFTRGRGHKQAKAIGRGLQQWGERKIGECLDEPYGKDTEICARAASQTGPDIGLSPRVRKLFPFTVECKSGNSVPIPTTAIGQAIANLYEGTDWLVMLDRPHPLKEKRVPPIVVMDGETFFWIWRRICQSRTKRQSPRK